MVVSKAIQSEIEEKVKQYDDAKEKIKETIIKKIGMTIKKLKTVQEDLIDEVEGEFGENPFSEFLGNKDKYTDADAKRLLAKQKIPDNFGPDEKSFSALISEIDSLKEWQIFVPEKLEAKSVAWDSITLKWNKVSGASSYQIEVDGSISLNTTPANIFIKAGFFPETEHSFRVRAVRGSSVSEWSGIVKGRTLKAPEFSECVLKKCPYSVDEGRKYNIYTNNPKIATKVSGGHWCTVIGNTPIPPNTVTTWSIKVLKSEYNNGANICIGVAPSDINRNDFNINKCGWYFDCWGSTLWSGPPYNYRKKEYGPRKGDGQYVRTGNSVGVVLNTTKSELSFVLSGVNLGVAYEGIPLDKPLVPCVLLWYEGDSVELDPSEVKETEVDSSVPVPSNVITKSITWDSITLTWDEVSNALSYQIEVDGGISCDATTTNTFTKSGLLPDSGHSFRVRAARVSEWSGVAKGRTLKIPIPSNIIAKSTTWDSITLTWDKVSGASSYQIEVDGNRSLYTFTTNTYTWRGLLPETEHSFRVRTVRGSPASEWSGVVKRETLVKSFKTGGWNGCPNNVDDDKKYSVNLNNPKIATKVANGYCTIIGNTLIPSNKVTSWTIKVLKSRDNNGGGICIGVAPPDINQNEKTNTRCGWYFYCYRLALCSGPPHNYVDKEYLPWAKYGQYVRTGDSVGVVVDTTKGELSFVVNGVNHGVMYKGIPLDKPLVPCVLLKYEGDSVELDTSGVKENVDSSIPFPSNATVKSATWNTITLTWDKVIDASFYQIEVDGSKSWGASTTNTFTKSGFLPETEHSFRVRTVRGNSVSKWSGAVKGRTLRTYDGVWKECPDDVYDDRKYSADGRNPRIATKLNSNGWCTIIGNTHIPLNKATQWNIKVLESENNDGINILIGIVPNDINQNDVNWNKCGWYFYCFCSALFSGPPHNCGGKIYGPRKEDGQYVRTGDSVGVVMDTTRGDLSFILNGVNLGVAYEWIPLDKPLVPCVLLYQKGDSVELDTSEVKENVDSSVPVPSNATTNSILWGFNYSHMR